MAAAASRGPRGPYAAGREAQRCIVDAAREVFAERGYRGGSLRDVAERAGVSAANIVHHFGSKEGLLVAVLEARDANTDLIERGRRGDIVEGMRLLVRTNQTQRSIVGLYAVLSAEATDPAHPAHDYFRERYARVLRIAVTAVEAARAKGNLPAGPPAEQVAAGLLAVMDGLQNQWLFDPEFDMAAAFDAHLRMIGARFTSDDA
ncbi:TetR/AcrR family transcriptional regulator [Streptomyces specialis]|uniref:TetR/AcrR family transcriptional regulator n=1 Tax=Streptomyces specialis TaxID=498367 RepID=UPI00073E72B1|nr:TetR/AcrR family transcriptional regulator [Streptomyces specialis]